MPDECVNSVNQKSVGGFLFWLHELRREANGVGLLAYACSHLERHIGILYRSKVYTKVNELRWFLFSNLAAEREKLPPTSDSLDLHIR